jgi:hypothetical protein
MARAGARCTVDVTGISVSLERELPGKRGAYLPPDVKPQRQSPMALLSEIFD